jgi:hypothetical protein
LTGGALRIGYWGTNFIDSTENGASITQMDTITLNNKKWNNLLFFEYPDGVDRLSDWFREAYIGKNIGTIQYIDKNGDIWKLQKYNIVQ